MEQKPSPPLISPVTVGPSSPDIGGPDVKSNPAGVEINPPPPPPTPESTSDTPDFQSGNF